MKMSCLLIVFLIGTSGCGDVTALFSANVGGKSSTGDKLWQSIEDAYDRKDWAEVESNLRAVEARFPQELKAWRYHAWVLAFNCSLEEKRVCDRYDWVVRGCRVLIEARTPTRNHPAILWELADLLNKKLGRGMDWKEYRELFREDESFHAELALHIDLEKTLGPDGRPDSFLVARELFLLCERRLMENNQEINQTSGTRISPVIWFSFSSRALIHFAETLCKEQASEDDIQKAWEWAARGWEELGNKPIPWEHPVTHELTWIKLNGLEGHRAETLKGLVRYDYWRKRIAWEGQRDVIHARRLLWALNEALEDPHSDSRQLEHQFWEFVAAWSQVLYLNDYALLDDFDPCLDVGKVIRIYLLKRNEPIPENFPLQPILDLTYRLDMPNCLGTNSADCD